ncbi:MAG TPA: GIY-YIG nuclease family protein, partial [Chryseosolibacter sp.]
IGLSCFHSSHQGCIGLMFFVYIIYSDKLKKYYAGSTNDVDKRLIATTQVKARSPAGVAPGL